MAQTKVHSTKPQGARKGRRTDELILALMQNTTIERAAAAAGVSEVTLWRRMREPEFQDQYRQARREAFAHSVVRLQHASSAAVSTLLRVMTDPAAPAHSRVRAADSVLDRSLQAMELEDLEVRLARLEERQTNPDDEPSRGR